MKRFRSIKWLFLLQAAVALTLVFLSIASSMQIVVFHYPRIVNNDPLVSPKAVKSVCDNAIFLEDGRSIQINTEKPLVELISQSGFRIDLEPVDDVTLVAVYVRERGWLCGTPWAGLINIPLIADDVPINRRVEIGLGRTMPSNGQSQVGVPSDCN